MISTSFDFSVIMAVYNVAPYLEEAVDSLRKQTLGFDRIQVILVDDGSTDASGALCDRLAQSSPENVVVLHQPNGGQASARNLGLTQAKGAILNFMDPDDKLTENTLACVLDFFHQHENEVDVVSIPMELFGAQTGPHWQNSKFQKGSRLISLLQEYKVQQTSTSSAFYHRPGQAASAL